jgi:orotidine-5'-phosphate decarboxylase
MPEHFADRLLNAIAAKGAPVCVGLDPRVDRLPDELRQGPPVEAVETFCTGVLDAVAPVVPAVKPQIAYFEQLGPEGTALYFRVVAAARRRGLIVIGDVKRNDIGSTAEAYAVAHLAGADAPDAVTVNGYLGADGIQPFLDVAKETGRGIFVLVRTSNPSAATVQDFTDASGTKLYEHMAKRMAEMGDADRLVGDSGYSCLGAVVGATWPAEAAALRTIMPRQLFLVPGYGAQGGTAADCAASFADDGRGAIVNASRSVIYAHADDACASMAWTDAVAAAARAFADDIAGAIR